MRPINNSFGKRLALAAVAALLLALPPVAKAQEPAPQNVPFKISSLGTAFAVQVEVEGTYTVNEDSVEVYVERAYVYVSEKCPYQGRRLINNLVIGLATSTTRRGWDMENSSLPVFVERVMSPRDEYRLAGLHFRIPRSVGSDLTKRWLVVAAEETALDLPEGDREQKGYAFAHSRRDLFAARGAANGR